MSGRHPHRGAREDVFHSRRVKPIRQPLRWGGGGWCLTPTRALPGTGAASPPLPVRLNAAMRIVTDYPRAVRTIATEWVTLSDGTRLAAKIWLPEGATEIRCRRSSSSCPTARATAR